ncbi:MAG TPA: hypothetical protein VKQ08_11805 [Cyclobacteriaceae bacterium]|nr:hypothetical protein [Cyclobacteriaceae bacterium]
MSIASVLDAIPAIKYTELQAYLRNTGWRRRETSRSDIGVFLKETDTNVYEVLLPLTRDFADYRERLLDVLEQIATVEEREIDQVLTDLTVDPADIVRFRVVSSDTVGGTISFLEGFNLLESAKKALFTTACDLIKPEKYHRRLGLKGAQQFIEKCRLGQTEKGSFVASVICPFLNHSEEDEAQRLTIFNSSLDLSASFTRKVTRRMMWALAEVKRSIDRAEENRIIDLQGEDIISANFLESIIELNSIKESREIEIKTSWSIFAYEHHLLNDVIRLSNDYLPVLETIVSKIRPSDEGIEDLFVGKISLTKADPDANTRSDGEIILNYVLGDEEKVSKARVTLNAEDYRKACEAHLKGQTVKVKGRLITSGRSKFIQNPSLEVVS